MVDGQASVDLDLLANILIKELETERIMREDYNGEEFKNIRMGLLQVIYYNNHGTVFGHQRMKSILKTLTNGLGKLHNVDNVQIFIDFINNFLNQFKN